MKDGTKWWMSINLGRRSTHLYLPRRSWPIRLSPPSSLWAFHRAWKRSSRPCVLGKSHTSDLPLGCLHWNSHNRLSKAGYACPRCGVKNCLLPTECAVCALTLVSPAHLARSYHHLFPIPEYLDPSDSGDLPQQVGHPLVRSTGGAEAYPGADAMDEDVPEPAVESAIPEDASNSPRTKEREKKKRKVEETVDVELCSGCRSVVSKDTPAEAYTVCPDCRQHFCLSCDAFVHGHSTQLPYV